MIEPKTISDLLVEHVLKCVANTSDELNEAEYEGIINEITDTYTEKLSKIFKDEYWLGYRAGCRKRKYPLDKTPKNICDICKNIIKEADHER